MEEKPRDKIFIEKEGKLRLIIDQRIGFIKVMDQLRERFKVTTFNNRHESEKILLIEEKNNIKE